VRKFLHEKKLPDIQIIIVGGTEALTRNYNEGLRQSKYKIKFFIHDDVDIMDTGSVPLFVRVEELFNQFPNTGLIGLVGTLGPSNGWWWDTTSKEDIVGHAMVGGDETDMYWRWTVEKEVYSDVKFIDGLFMATPLNIPFSEDIMGFHFYDSDYCNVIRQNGYDIKIVTHLARHDATSLAGFHADLTHYREKWKLSDKSLRNW
jgi:hypothetical protein